MDDKAPKEDFSSHVAIERLNEQQKSIVDYFSSGEGLWKEIAIGDDVELVIDFSMYSHIFLHSALGIGLKGLLPVLLHKLSQHSRVVLLSGNQQESKTPVVEKQDPIIAPNTEVYKILRRQYFSNLSAFIDSFFLFGDLRIEYLYDSSGNPKRDLARNLLNTLIQRLEVSTQAALTDPVFDKLLKLYEYADTLKVKQNLENKAPDEIQRRLEALIANK